MGRGELSCSILHKTEPAVPLCALDNSRSCHRHCTQCLVRCERAIRGSPVIVIVLTPFSYRYFHNLYDQEKKNVCQREEVTPEVNNTFINDNCYRNSRVIREPAVTSQSEHQGAEQEQGAEVSVSLLVSHGNVEE